MVDFLYVMCYDTRSQIFDSCVASANAPLPGNFLFSSLQHIDFTAVLYSLCLPFLSMNVSLVCMKGIEQFSQTGVSPDQLVLGVPWYGYRYECVGEFDLLRSKTCAIAHDPFRGVNCSDAAGSEHSYKEIRSIVNSGRNTSIVFRDEYLNVPFFNYEEAGKPYQVWYDDTLSLRTLYQFAKDANLRGTGPYRWDQLDLINNPHESSEMFNALKEIFSEKTITEKIS